MALKHKIAALTDVAEAVRSFYEAGQDGAFYLQVEGMDPSAKLDEFRNNNIELKNKVTEYETKYKDVDLVKYKELLAAAGKTPQEIEDAVKARVAQMAQEHAAALAERDAKITTLSSTLSTVLVDGTLKSEAVKAGVLPTAVDDIVLRGRMIFSAQDGNLVAKDSKGNALYDKDGTSPLAPASWLKDLKKNAPHLFTGMSGGGSNGNGGKGPGGMDMSKATPTQKIAAGLAMQKQGG